MGKPGLGLEHQAGEGRAEFITACTWSWTKAYSQLGAVCAMDKHLLSLGSNLFIQQVLIECCALGNEIHSRESIMDMTLPFFF